jgi:hypothetical protein
VHIRRNTRDLREIVKYFQAVTFIAPFLSWCKVTFLWHINDTPLHCIDAVVWDGVNSCSVRQGMDNVVIAVAFFGLKAKYIAVIFGETHGGYLSISSEF